FSTDSYFFLVKPLQQRFEMTRKVSYLNVQQLKFKVMSLRNKVTLIGRTGKDVETIELENGLIAKVSLATSDFYKNSKGEKIEETQWHNLVAFGKTAEIMSKFVEKGNEIVVEGKITYRNYDDKEGNKRTITEIRVDEIVLVGGK